MSFEKLSLCLTLAGMTTCGCGGGGQGSSGSLGNPVPSISSTSPTRATAGGQGLTLTVNGVGFISGSVVLWNGSERSTTLVSQSQLTAVISATDVASPGAAEISVLNPSPGGGTSGTVGFTLSAAGVIARVSVASDGTEANGASANPSISADGQFVAFDSAASNLVLGDTNATSDVFLRETCVTASVGCVPSTSRVSVATDGTEGNGSSTSPSVSADGRFVAFVSAATNLVAEDTNNVSDVFVRDTCQGVANGCTPSTIRVSVASNGDQADGASSEPSLSADGRFVAFTSTASNLGAKDPGRLPSAADIFVRDTCAGMQPGCVPSTLLVSRGLTVGFAGLPEGIFTFSPSISADGRYVAFGWGDSLFQNPRYAISVGDTCVGAPTSCMPGLSSPTASNGPDGPLVPYFSDPALDGTGQFIAFQGVLVSGLGDFTEWNVYVRDIVHEVTSKVAVISPTSLNPSAKGSVAFSRVATSQGARLVAFDSDATQGQVLVQDTCLGAPAGCGPTSSQVSISSDGTQSGGDTPAISSDGGFVAFVSRANLVPEKRSSFFDIFTSKSGFAPSPTSH